VPHLPQKTNSAGIPLAPQEPQVPVYGPQTNSLEPPSAALPRMPR